MIWMVGTCKDNGYGNRRSCGSNGKNCKTLEEERKYSDLAGHSPI